MLPLSQTYLNTSAVQNKQTDLKPCPAAPRKILLLSGESFPVQQKKCGQTPHFYYTDPHIRT